MKGWADLFFRKSFFIESMRLTDKKNCICRRQRVTMKGFIGHVKPDGCSWKEIFASLTKQMLCLCCFFSGMCVKVTNIYLWTSPHHHEGLHRVTVKGCILPVNTMAVRERKCLSVWQLEAAGVLSRYFLKLTKKTCICGLQRLTMKGFI